MRDLLHFSLVCFFLFCRNVFFSWPHRLPLPYKPLDLAEIGTLTFKKPDHAKYPCIQLAYEAGRAGGTMTCVLNAANEAANEKFRSNVGLEYLDIPRLIESAMEAHKADCKMTDVTLEDILHSDEWARQHVEELCRKRVAVQYL